MTTPLPANLTFPDWYAGGFPDIEMLMQKLFQPMLGTIQTPNDPTSAYAPTYVVSYLPQPAIYNPWLDQGYGYLRAYRMGGGINFDQNRDEPRVALAALTRRRSDSWYLIEFVRQILNAYQRGGQVPGVPGVTLWMAGEGVGPQQIPEIIENDRLVQITVALHTKRAGLPDYKRLLNS